MNIIILSIKEKKITLELFVDNRMIYLESWLDNNDILEIFFEELDKLLKLNNLNIKNISKFKLKTENPFGYTTVRIAETLISSLNFSEKEFYINTKI